MKLRMVSRVLVVALVVAIGAFALLRDRVFGESQQAKLVGTDLGTLPAPDFTLTDQNGARVSLGDLKGHPVVVSFLYTHCPDECPLTAEKMRQSAEALGAKADAVRWVAVSLDPEGDTPDAAKHFVSVHKLDGKLRFLLGTRAQLEPVWNDYHTAVLFAANHDSSGQGVSHSGGIFLVDAQGRQRIFFGSDFDPAALTTDLKALAG